jgi:hypothetical protein
MPIIRQAGILIRFFLAHGSFGADGEMDPARAMRATTDEPRVIPPGSNEGIVNVTAMVFEAKVDRLHRLPTIGVGTKWIVINNMRCHLTLLAASSVEVMHHLALFGG